MARGLGGHAWVQVARDILGERPLEKSDDLGGKPLAEREEHDLRLLASNPCINLRAPANTLEELCGVHASVVPALDEIAELCRKAGGKPRGLLVRQHFAEHRKRCMENAALSNRVAIDAQGF